jgi:23S rRNA (adenine2503-C2)-methyltransferase
MFHILNSTEDASVNFVKHMDVGYTEARFVKRNKDRFIVYLSSQTGCNRGCRFCHLTTSGQTQYIDVDPEGYVNQAKTVLQYYNSLEEKTKTVHYNFMARGEALSNKHMVESSYSILSSLSELAIENDLIPKFNLSTIMPRNVKALSLSKMFRGITPTIYYSIYSIDNKFRDKWLPGALDVSLALDKLSEYQQDSKKIIKLHWAFIDQENDSEKCMDAICNEVLKRKLIVDVNIVRYNPYSNEYGKETSIDKIKENVKYLSSRLNCNVKIIDRVGFDVKASCGMFV